MEDNRIDKVRAEVERLIKNHYDLTEFNSGYKNAMADILSFIDLMKEEPKNMRFAWYVCIKKCEFFTEGKIYKINIDDQDISWICGDNGHYWKFDFFLRERFRPAKKNELPEEPKFKVGDTIRNISSGELFHIEKVDGKNYWDGRDSFYIMHQDQWERIEEVASAVWRVFNKQNTPFPGREIIVRRGDKKYYGKYIGGRFRYVRADIQLNYDTAFTYAVIDNLSDGDEWAYLDDIQKNELYMKRVQESAFEKGRDDMKKQMMADAIERRVKVDAGGYPYIDCEIELYDYEKDVALAKKGDIAKVLVVIDDRLV